MEINNQHLLNEIRDNLQDKSKNYIFQSFRNALVTIIKWVEISSLFIRFFYSDIFFKVIQEKINDSKQISCIPFILLSIFITDMQMFDEIHNNSERNFQYTFISNLQQYIRCTIDKLTECFSPLLSKEIVEKLAIESFDSIINILNQTYEQTTEKEENQFLDQLSIDDKKLENNEFFNEAKQMIFSKLNQRKCLLEKYVTCNWKKMIDYIEQQDHLKFCLILDSDKFVQIISQIIVNFEELKNDIISMKQTVENICQAGIDKIDTYVSKHNEINANIMKNEDDEFEQKAYELFIQLNEEMCKANFADFTLLFDEFY